MSTKTTERLPPYSLESEQGILACMLLDPAECIPEAVEKLKSHDRFYDARHQDIFRTLAAMSDERQPVDIITLQERLKKKNRLDGIGGPAYISELMGCTPSTANIGHYIEYVLDFYALRVLLKASSEITSSVYKHDKVETVIDDAQKLVGEAAQCRIQPKEVSMRALCQGAVDTMEFLLNNKGQITGVETGLRDLDAITNGLQPGDMIVVAARPSCGKTSLAMNIAEHVAINKKLPVGVFSLEMTAQSLVMRMLCSGSRVNIRDIQRGFLEDRQLPKIIATQSRLASAPIHIDDSSGISIFQLRAKARKMAQQFGIKLLIVDYLQLMSADAENRTQEISKISNGLKSIAKELNVPVIVLSQLNREVEKRSDPKPKLSDLRESGAIEQDADVVALLYREREDDTGDCIPVHLLIAKQRNGMTGDIALMFHRSYTRFDSVSKVALEDAA